MRHSGRSSTMSTTSSPFLNLPPELRNHIYELCTVYRPTDHPMPASRSPLALSLTCRKLYEETHALAFPATTFRTRRWALIDLKTRLSKVRLAYRPHIRHLELTVDISDFVMLMTMQCFNGLQFAAAGLVGLEEFYLNLTGQYDHNKLEGHAVSNLETLIWKTVADSGNHHLKKIRVVHNGLLRWHTIKSLGERMRQRLVDRWNVYDDPTDGRLKMIKDDPYYSDRRNVLVLLGFNIQEAEMYAAVRQDLLQGRVLKHICARLPPNIDAADLESEAMAFQIERISQAFGIRPSKFDSSNYY